jgi:hypothetical protein
MVKRDTSLAGDALKGLSLASSERPSKQCETDRRRAGTSKFQCRPTSGYVEIRAINSFHPCSCLAEESEELRVVVFSFVVERLSVVADDSIHRMADTRTSGLINRSSPSRIELRNSVASLTSAVWRRMD